MRIVDTRNARFNWLGTKITLPAGQFLNHETGGRTDEGYCYHWVTFHHNDQGIVTAECGMTASDCDGQLETYHDLVLEPDGHWCDVLSSQRDHTAESMNY